MNKKITTVRVSLETRAAVRRLMGELQRHVDYRVTQDEAIEYAVERTMHDIEREGVAYPVNVEGF
jgi:hypothetical protein